MPARRGDFIWYDVMTTDPKAATSFYSQVIGWDAQEHTMQDGRAIRSSARGRQWWRA
jgi:predicted enzyme related to lactoylglutathione lyase